MLNAKLDGHCKWMFVIVCRLLVIWCFTGLWVSDLKIKITHLA